jgi:hypothetical protein
MSKFKGKFFSRQFFSKKGLKWTSEMFFFEFSALILLYQSTEFADAVDEIASNTLLAGGRLDNIFHEFTAMRNSATFIHNSRLENLTDKNDIAFISKVNFDAGKFIGYIRKIRNNTISTNVLYRYLVVLAKELNITNAQLRNFASLIGKFDRLPAKQQIETVKRMRNYAAFNYKGAESNLITTKLYYHLVAKYNTTDTYTDSKKAFGLDKNTAKNAALVGLVALGTTQMTKGLLNLYTDRNKGESWASKIAGKAEHRGFDDSFRN